MFYCKGSNATALTKAMKKMGLKLMKFHFDFEGAKILVNMKKY
jgi:galactokinase/mevalonate kinase-like predicted kinase